MGIAADIGLLVVHLYFLAVHAVFVLVNFFIKKQHVPPPVDDLVMLSATEAVKKIRHREIRPSQLVEAYIHRIEQVNPLINAAVVTMFDGARKVAKEYDQQLDELTDHAVDDLLRRRPLFGVPFSCKDSLEVKGQLVTSGSYYRRDNICENTAVAVQRVQDAGGILVAITNVPELCSWVETTNCVYGQSNNPYDLRRIVGGSSGGEGALLSAAGTPIGVGSDVGGSIRIPSFVNGIFGLMPTPGVVPLDGHVPAPLGYKKQMLRIGPMCRYAEDIPLLLKVMAADELFGLQLDDTVDFRQCRVFYMLGIRHPLIEPLSNTMRETLEKAVSHFEKTFNLEGVGLDLPLTLHHHEFYSASLDGNVPLSKKVLSLEGDAGQLNLRSELPRVLSLKSHHSLAILMVITLESLSHSTEESRAESIRIRDRLKRQIVETLGNNGFLFFPSWPKPAPYHREPLFAVLNTAYTALFNALALPVVQCPMGLDANGIPLGVQVVAAPGCERLLVAVAKEISVAFGGWKPAWEK